MRSKELETYKQKLKLSDLQREILVGLLLGDAHLETQNEGRTYRLKIEQSVAHSPYVMHLHDVFRSWVGTPPRTRVVERLGKESSNVCFQTLSHGSFRFYGQQFYADRKKCVPELINQLLTPRALAYWFMDDGSIKSKDSKGLILNTQAFAPKDISKLCDVLKAKFDLRAKTRPQKDGFQLYIFGESFETFCHLAGPFVLPEMLYKIPSARQT